MEDENTDNAQMELAVLSIDGEVEMKGTEPEDDGLIPLPIDEHAEPLDVEMKANDATDASDAGKVAIPEDVSAPAPALPLPVVAETIELNLKEEAVEEEEEEEIIEEEEEEGGVVMDASSQPQPKPQPKPSSDERKDDEQETTTAAVDSTSDKEEKKEGETEKEKEERPKFHAIVMDESKSRFLNLHLMKEWTHNEVLQWLAHRFGLWGQQYVPAFANKSIDGQQLVALNEQQLRDELGVNKPLHLMRICRDIQDALRPVSDLSKLIQPCLKDGGNTASKLMRFGPKEVCAFALKLPALKPYANNFLERRINGRVLLQANNDQLATAINTKDKTLTLVETKSIVECLEYIKREAAPAGADDVQGGDAAAGAAIDAVNQVWNAMCSASETRFKLLPQHIRDYSKPAPVYYAPAPSVMHPQQQYAMQAVQHLSAPQSAVSVGGVATGGPILYGQPPSHVFVKREESAVRTPALLQQKDVMQWTTEDCVTWLGQIRESKVDLKVRYTQHFEQVRMTGAILLNMTPHTLSRVCCITTKTHLKQLVKAIDNIRDHIVTRQFAQQPHVLEFSRKYGGGFHFPTIRDRADIAVPGPQQQQQQHVTQVQAQPQPPQPPQPPTTASTQSLQQPQPQQQSQPQQQQQDGDEDEDEDTSMSSRPRRATNEEVLALAQPSAKSRENIAAGHIKKSPKKKGEESVACFVCGKTGNVMRCSQCKQAFYCSREHQISDWPKHSKTCNK